MHDSCPLYTFDAAEDSLRVDLGGRRLIKKKNIYYVITTRRHIIIVHNIHLLHYPDTRTLTMLIMAY